MEDLFGPFPQNRAIGLFDDLPPFDLPICTTPLTEFPEWSEDLLDAARAGDEQDLIEACLGESGQMYLCVAAMRGQEMAVRALLAAHADMEMTWWGKTALAWAAGTGDVHCVNVLLSAKANARLLDPEGHTPLSLAKSRQRTKVVTLLQGTSPPSLREACEAVDIVAIYEWVENAGKKFDPEQQLSFLAEKRRRQSSAAAGLRSTSTRASSAALASTLGASGGSQRSSVARGSTAGEQPAAGDPVSPKSGTSGQSRPSKTAADAQSALEAVAAEHRASKATPQQGYGATRRSQKVSDDDSKSMRSERTSNAAESTSHRSHRSASVRERSKSVTPDDAQSSGRQSMMSRRSVSSGQRQSVSAGMADGEGGRASPRSGIAIPDVIPKVADDPSWPTEMKWLTRRIAVNCACEVNRNTAIILAAREGLLDLVADLVEAGVDVNGKDKLGKTAILHAAMRRQIHVVEYLLMFADSAELLYLKKEGMKILEDYRD